MKPAHRQAGADGASVPAHTVARSRHDPDWIERIHPGLARHRRVMDAVDDLCSPDDDALSGGGGAIDGCLVDGLAAAVEDHEAACDTGASWA